MFVLEFGRTLVEQGLPEIGSEIPVPDSVEEMLGTRVAGLSDGVRRLLLAVSLSADLRVAELRAIGPTEAVEDAVDAGVLVIDGTRVRASHPAAGCRGEEAIAAAGAARATSRAGRCGR